MTRFRARCSACDKKIWWRVGQQWNRCRHCETLNYCEDGAQPGLHPAWEDG